VGQKVPYKSRYAASPREQQAWAAIRRQNADAAAGAMTVLEALQAFGAAGVRVQQGSPVVVAHTAIR
jgi:hypothetical protein